MKQLIFTMFFVWAFSSCNLISETEPAHQDGIVPSSIEQITDVFELKYGEVKECNYDGQVFKLSITDIEDNRVPCYLMDLGGNPEALNRIRLHACLRMDISKKTTDLKVSSGPCGGIGEKDIQNVWDSLGSMQACKANQEDASYFTKIFPGTFGEDSLISNTPFSIYLADAYPSIKGWEDLTSEIDKNQYKFIFIITNDFVATDV